MNMADFVGVALGPIMPVLQANASLLLGGVLIMFAVGGTLIGVARFLALVVGLCLALAAAVPHLPLGGE